MVQQMVMFSLNLLFSHKSSLNASRFEVIDSLFMGQTNFFPSGGTNLTDIFSMSNLEVTLPSPISFVMSGQSHVNLADWTCPIDGGHSVLSARSGILKWGFTGRSQGSRVRETNLSRLIQGTRFHIEVDIHGVQESGNFVFLEFVCWLFEAATDPSD